MRTPTGFLRKGKEFRRGFAQDERGNIVILFAFLLVPMLLAVGLAIDSLRALNAATTTANALDAAALAAARAMADGNLSDADVRTEALRFFEANVKSNSGTSEIQPQARSSFAASFAADASGGAKGSGSSASGSSHSGFDVKANRETGEVTVAVDTIVPTTLGQLANISEFKFRREATALAGVGEIELGLMLDVTGSMNRRGKLDALKKATSDLFEIIIPEGRYADRVRIGLAPYSTQVNMGRYANRVRDRNSSARCVVERENGFLNTDAAPSGNDLFNVLTEEQIEEFEDLRNQQPACPDAEILPLTSDKGELLRTVNSYRARGYTAGHLGIQWAWNLVSPKWGGVWGGGSRPKDYGAKDLIKAVVLMTDGQFNSAFTGRIADQAMKAESFGHADDLCRNMKREGVVVFSVAFDLRHHDAREALEDCATNGDFFYRAENEKQLRAAYRDIAIKLTQLRLSK